MKLLYINIFVILIVFQHFSLDNLTNKFCVLLADLVKLNNSIFNHGPKDAFRFTLGQNLVEVSRSVSIRSTGPCMNRYIFCPFYGE